MKYNPKEKWLYTQEISFYNVNIKIYRRWDAMEVTYKEYLVIWISNWPRPRPIDWD